MTPAEQLIARLVLAHHAAGRAGRPDHAAALEALVDVVTTAVVLDRARLRLARLAAFLAGGEGDAEGGR